MSKFVSRFRGAWIAAFGAAVIASIGGAVQFRVSHARSTEPAHAGVDKTQGLSAEQRGRIRANMEALPLAFEANQGQLAPQVKYAARGNGYSVFLTADDAVFAISSAKQPQASSAGSRPRRTRNLQSAAIDMRLIGRNSKPDVVASNELAGVANYYLGSDPNNWHAGVKQYSSVSYREVYPGVTMVFHGAQRQLEFDFVISPGADAKRIGLGLNGAQRIATDASGNLVLVSSAGDVVLHKPVAYQEMDGQREIVDAAFQVRKGNEVEITLGAYDRSRELVIDPSLSYSTYLGGNAEDDAYAIAIDGSGNAYVTGQTQSLNFPTVSGALSGSNAGGFDVFVTKLAANGTSLAYSTYIGGSGSDSGNAIAVDGSGNAFVAGGTTSSANFPTTTGALQTTFQGGSLDAFVLELASSGGSLTFSTFLGGNGDDVATGIALDSSGEYVVGSTTSTNFPTHLPYQPNIIGSSNGFVTKLNTSGNSLAYSTYLGAGTGDVATAVAVDNSGRAYVTGATGNKTFPTTPGAFQTTCGSDGNCNGGLSDAFVTVFNSTGSGLVYSTFLGGEGIDEGLGIAVDQSSRNAYVTGLTQSSVHFPLKSALQGTFGGGTQDAFVTELNASGSALVYSSFLGGSLIDSGTSIALDGNKNAYITGQTNSPDFPQAAATQTTLGGGRDAFVSEISATGSSLIFSTYLGGALDENTNASGGNLAAIGAIAVDNAGTNIYVAGNTASSQFPIIAGSVQTAYGGATDAFVARYSGASSSASFTVSNGPLSNTSGHAGVSATSTITVGSTNGFNSAVQLACSVSPVVTKGPTCSLTNPSVTPPANSTATSTLNVATTAASAALTHPAIGQHPGILYALVFPLFGLTLLGASVGSSGPRRGKLFGASMLGVLTICLFLMPACSSSSGGGKNNGTPPGTYTITVTGTNGSTVVTGTPALTLTVN